MEDDKDESSIGTQPLEKENQPLQSVPPQRQRQEHACPVDDDHDDHDVSSDDDDDDNDEIRADPLTLRQRRARNIQRNQAYLVELGLAQQAPHKRAVAASQSVAQKESTSRRGMLRKWNTTTTTATTTTFVDLRRDYPCRTSVLRALWGWLHRAGPRHEHGSLPMGAATAPLLVTGPAGTGKTALVRALVATAAASRSVAYVSCAATAAAGSSSSSSSLVQTVLQSAYQQLAQQANHQEERNVRSNINNKKRRRRRQVEQPLTLETTTKGDEDDDEVDLEDRLEAKRRRRGRKKTSLAATASSSPNATATTAKASSVHTAVWAFGRALQALQMGQMILVLDEAERLATEHDVNVLAQLYLLPQALQLSLQIVLVTRSVLLCESRLNASLGTLSTCVQPIRIHFAAYRGQEQLKAILSTSHMRRKIVGMDDDHDDNDKKWHEAVYQSFLHTLIQSLQDVSNSLHDYLHWGRALWPHYVQPLGPNVLEETVASLAASRRDDESMEQAVLGLLNRRLYPLVRAGLEHGLWQQPSGVHHHPPVLVRYMLLAAFLCQANRPDKDRHLYTNASHRRRNNHATADDNQQAVADRTVRPRAFGLERLLSVYASLVQLHHCDDEQAPADDGLVVLLEAQALGWLQQQSPGRYATTLLPNQARAMARSLDFALDRYLTTT